eukprot:TRINITY_DN1160_c0_g1_i1.p2 TRINITY_DN1160_c0_g1~~TRINITY_DN1160_c0_g1_i1.p2  ORF type:complete len:349 (+),score=23.78 TRINITY_DN1160_c0_g1_i1:136-1182(+)
MKTQPNVTSTLEIPAASFTETNSNARQQSTTEKETQKISFTQIKLSKTAEAAKKDEHAPTQEYYHSNFTYEKERIKALENTEFYATLQVSTANPDRNFLPQSSTQRTVETPQTNSLVPQIQKVVSIVFMLYAIVDFVMSFFAIIFLSISNLPVVQYLLWIVLEFLLTSLFIYASIKGHNAATFHIPSANWHILRISLTFLSHLCALLATELSKGIKQMLSCSMKWNKEDNSYEANIEAMKCIIIASFFFSCLIKAVTSALYLALGIAIRVLIEKRAKDEVELHDISMSAKKLRPAQKSLQQLMVLSLYNIEEKLIICHYLNQFFCIIIVINELKVNGNHNGRNQESPS